MELALLGVYEYAKELSGYVHSNPVRAELLETPAECEWKSFLEQKGQLAGM